MPHTMAARLIERRAYAARPAFYIVRFPCCHVFWWPARAGHSSANAARWAACIRMHGIVKLARWAWPHCLIIPTSKGLPSHAKLWTLYDGDVLILALSQDNTP